MSALPPPTSLASVTENRPLPAPPVTGSGLTRFHKIGLGLFCALLLGGAAAAYLIHASHHETTDDAYTTGNVHSISSRVAGTVVEVDVIDNQFVKKGQLLVRLDPRDFQVQVDKARADFKRAQADFERVNTLRGSPSGAMAISKQEFDQMEANLETAQASLNDAQDQLSYCTITAPEDGFVGDKTVQTGNRLAVGTVLMSVVQDLWIVSNYKETHVGKMTKGQRVKIQVDEIPGRTFDGVIDSFAPGTGSIFALLPPENATGNFTKIVQRIPVKILFDRESIRGYELRLVPGISVETDVSLIAPPEQALRAVVSSGAN